MRDLAPGPAADRVLAQPDDAAERVADGVLDGDPDITAVDQDPVDQGTRGRLRGRSRRRASSEAGPARRPMASGVVQGEAFAGRIRLDRGLPADQRVGRSEAAASAAFWRKRFPP